MKRNYLFFIFVFFLSGSLFSEQILCKVIGVSDGDTIRVLADKSEEKVRLAGIDAPEKDQDFGQKAKQALSKKIFGEKVEIRYDKRDRYGRIVGDVYYNGRWINLEMVQEGMAWQYTQYSNDADLRQAEESARQGKLGLWRDENPQPPWEFRHGGGNSGNQPPRGEYCASRNGKVYHKPECKSVSKIKEKNVNAK